MPKTKSKKKKSKTQYCDPEFAPQWVESEIDLSKSPTKLIRLFQGKSAQYSTRPQSPLTWFVDEASSGEAVEQIDSWHQAVLAQTDFCQHFIDVRQSVEQLTASEVNGDGHQDIANGEDAAELSKALVTIAAVHSLRAISGHGPYIEWNGLVTRLLEISTAAESNVRLAPAIYQILAIEVPLAIAFQVPEIEDHRQLAVCCCRKLELSLGDMLDHDGWPHARYLDVFGVLGASWLRCGLMLEKMKIEMQPDPSSQLQWVVRQLLRIAGPDDRLLFSTGRIRPMAEDLMRCLKRFSSDPHDKRILKSRRLDGSNETSKPEPRISISKKGDSKKKKLPPSSCVSEWGESGVLRSRWRSNSPIVGFDYSSSSIGLAIARSENLISGVAMPKISINSAAVVVDQDLEIVCQQSDKDVEYIELETDLGKDAVFNRQILLSREEEFLLIADVVVPGEPARIDYRCDYPLTPGIVGMRETENREVYLRTSEIQSLVLPLALPEWKVADSDDRLEFDDSNLTLVQSIDGRGLYAPLFFDLNPNRSRLKRTWRQLTVGENLESVPRDVACAYRVQLDGQQWCFYRAISEQGNRTFLGENVTCEFVFNRFRRDGKVTTLLMI